MPVHGVIDNRTERLVDRIRRILPGSQTARFAVGYFFFSGLEAVADRLANVREPRMYSYAAIISPKSKLGGTTNGTGHASLRGRN